MRSFYSNLLSGESFEPEPGVTWGQNLLPSTADAKVTLEGRDAGMHGQTALHVEYHSGSGLVGLGNRGFRNEGLFMQASPTHRDPIPPPDWTTEASPCPSMVHSHPTPPPTPSTPSHPSPPLPT